MRRIVVPGELLSRERKRLGENVFVREGQIFSSAVGIFDNEPQTAGVIALEGGYAPKADDLVVGVVATESFAGYSVQINSYYPSFVSKENVREPLKRGSVISAKVLGINEINEVSLGYPRVFYGGEIVAVPPVKVPRIIGKNSSMLDVLRNGTGCNVMVGRNGWIWVKGGSPELFQKAVEKIVREAHLSNLTNNIEAFLKENYKPIGEKV